MTKCGLHELFLVIKIITLNNVICYGKIWCYVRIKYFVGFIVIDVIKIIAVQTFKKMAEYY